MRAFGYCTKKKRIRPIIVTGVVPVCPKCGKLISDKRYERHLRRCGVQHKHAPGSAEPPEDFLMRI